MQSPNALAMRDLLVFVAMVASAVTWHVRQQSVAPTSTDMAGYGRICEPSPSSKIGDARMTPADCGTRANVHPVHVRALWV